MSNQPFGLKSCLFFGPPPWPRQMLSKQGCGLCPGGRGCVPGVCYSQNVMLCLQCRRWQPKEAWSKAQWKRLQCVALDLQRNCCSECSTNWWKPTATTKQPDLGRQRPPPRACMCPEPPRRPPRRLHGLRHGLAGGVGQSPACGAPTNAIRRRSVPECTGASGSTSIYSRGRAGSTDARV